MTFPAIAADACDDVLERAEADELGARLHSALLGLSAAQRIAVELRVVDELSYEEIAARLDCTQSAARIRVSRALEKLQVRLQEVAR